MNPVSTRRLLDTDRPLAREMFTVVAEVFGEPAQPLGDDYLDSILRLESFWAFAAIADGRVVAGITAHTLPLTRTEARELFIYDLAVRADYQRRGIGGQLIRDLRHAAAAAGIEEVFVAADNEDEHALAFYRSQGAQESPVSLFSFTHVT